MKYEAIYETTTEVVTLAVDILKSDTYYAVQAGGWGPCYGTGVLKHNRESGEFYVNINGACKPLEEIDKNDILSIGTVGWQSCAGNYTGLTFREDDTFLLEIDSRRHGVPFKGQLMKALSSSVLLKEIKYSSSRDHWEWYETLENHKGELPPKMFEEEEIWAAEPKRISLRRYTKS